MYVIITVYTKQYYYNLLYKYFFNVNCNFLLYYMKKQKKSLNNVKKLDIINIG